MAPATPGGRAIILGTLGSVSGKIDQGLWMADAAGTLHLLLREGETIGNTTLKSFSALPAVTGQFGISRSINSHGQIAVRVTTADGAQHVAVVSAP